MPAPQRPNDTKSLIAQVRLRDLVLEYFMSPRTSRKMNDAPEFANHDNKQIRRMLHSLSEAGLIWRVRGSNTGAIYETTADGKILLKEMQKYEIVDN